MIPSHHQVGYFFMKIIPTFLNFFITIMKALICMLLYICLILSLLHIGQTIVLHYANDESHPTIGYFLIITLVLLINRLSTNYDRKSLSLSSFSNVAYATLLHLPPLRVRFHCVRGCWYRTLDCCDFGIDSQTH